MGASLAVYYNEIDPYPAQWLRNLMAARLIPAGDVDDRSIADVEADDLKSYSQCHFFAGIAGWSLALKLAGWPADRLVWTGSCPCQPFSAAGRRTGAQDKRHLWPDFRRLIADICPSVVFGEQVAGKLGRDWLFGVRTDLETLGYAVGAADLCSASINAPNIRQRLWWVANACCDERESRRNVEASNDRRSTELARLRTSGRLGKSISTRDADPRQRTSIEAPSGMQGQNEEREWIRPYARKSGDVISCLDGKRRRIEPSAFPLADGFPGRVGRLRAYGNAINPWVAKEFIQAVMAARP